MSTRRHATPLVVVMVAGTLALGACVTERTAADDGTEQQARKVHVDDTPAEARAAAARLSEIRAKYPTAGTEVPPADLVARHDAATSGPAGSLTRPHHTLRHAE